LYILKKLPPPPPPPPPPHLATTKTRNPADTPIHIYIYKPTGKRNDKKKPRGPAAVFVEKLRFAH